MKKDITKHVMSLYKEGKLSPHFINVLEWEASEDMRCIFEQYHTHRSWIGLGRLALVLAVASGIIMMTSLNSESFVLSLCLFSGTLVLCGVSFSMAFLRKVYSYYIEDLYKNMKKIAESLSLDVDYFFTANQQQVVVLKLATDKYLVGYATKLIPDSGEMYDEDISEEGRSLLKEECDLFFAYRLTQGRWEDYYKEAKRRRVA